MTDAIVQHRAEEEAIASLRQLHIDDGWHPDVATALAENGYDRDQVHHMSMQEVLECWLTWEGIIGFTGSILSAIRNIAGKKPEWMEQVCPFCGTH